MDAQTRALRLTDVLEAGVVAGEQRAQEQTRFDQQPQLTSDLIDELTFKRYGFATEEAATGVVLGVPVDAAPLPVGVKSAVGHR